MYKNMLKQSFMSLKLCTILQNYKTLHTLLRAIHSYKENYTAIKSYTGLFSAIKKATQGYMELYWVMHSFTKLQRAIKRFYRAIQRYSELSRAIHSYTELCSVLKSYTNIQRAIQPVAQILLHSTLKAPITSLMYSKNLIPGADAVNCCGRTIQM